MRLKTLDPVPVAQWITAVVLLAIVIAGIAFLAHRVGKQQFPPQAQASAMAVPTPTYKYQSAIAFQSCHLLVGVIFVDSEGKLHPVDPRVIQALNLSQALVLLSQAPASNTVSIEMPCHKDQSAGSSQPI